MRDTSGRLTWKLADEPDFVECGEEALAPQVKADLDGGSHVLGLSSVERPLEWVSWALL